MLLSPSYYVGRSNRALLSQEQRLLLAMTAARSFLGSGCWVNDKECDLIMSLG